MLVLLLLNLFMNTYFILCRCNRDWTSTGFLSVLFFSGEPIANKYWYSGEPNNNGKNFANKYLIRWPKCVMQLCLLHLEGHLFLKGTHKWKIEDFVMLNSVQMLANSAELWLKHVGKTCSFKIFDQLGCRLHLERLWLFCFLLVNFINYLDVTVEDSKNINGNCFVLIVLYLLS